MQWMHPEAQGDIPPPCRAHTATLVDRRLVVFGGGEGPVYRNDVYVLDTLTRRWQQPVFPVDAPQPPPRRAHTAVLYKGKVWVFGGGNGSQALNDLWTLDVNVPVERMKWEEQRTRGKAPVARGYHTANLVGNVMIIMGGSDGKECFSDIWCLNLGMSTSLTRRSFMLKSVLFNRYSDLEHGPFRCRPPPVIAYRYPSGFISIHMGWT